MDWKFQLRAFIPKFERMEKGKGVSEPVAYAFESETGKLVESKSFRDAASNGGDRDKKCTSEKGLGLNKQDEGKVMEFEPRTDEIEWLSRCWVGLLKEEFSWNEDGVELQSKCGIKMKIRYLKR